MRDVGESSVLLETSSAEAALALYLEIEAMADPAVIDAIPGARSVLVSFRRPPSPPQREHLAALESAPPGDVPPSGVSTHEIPVRYDGEDLASVAEATGLTIRELIVAHASTDYRVAFVGFQPGFGYLAGLPPALHLPRRATPRARIPAGSVAIAGEWAGIYPAPSPGGWHLLGTTDARLFDPSASPPSRLAPGDTVRFVAREAA